MRAHNAEALPLRTSSLKKSNGGDSIRLMLTQSTTRALNARAPSSALTRERAVQPTV
jgi:hypothetical protein